MKNKEMAHLPADAAPQEAKEHNALVELAEINAELAELHEEQQAFAMYAEFCRMRVALRGLADEYEEAGDMLRANAIRRSVPIAPEFLEYMKRSHDEKYFEEVILGTSNIFDALLVYGPGWLDYDGDGNASTP